MTHEERLAIALSYLNEEEREILMDGIRRRHNLPMSTEPIFYTDFDGDPSDENTHFTLKVMFPALDIEPDGDGYYFDDTPLFNQSQLRVILPFINRYLIKDVSLPELSKLLNGGGNDEDTPDVAIKSRKQRYVIAILVVLYESLAGKAAADRFRQSVINKFHIDPTTFATEFSKINTAMGNPLRNRKSEYSNPVKEDVIDQMRELEAALGLSEGEVY